MREWKIVKYINKICIAFVVLSITICSTDANRSEGKIEKPMYTAWLSLL